MLFTTATEWAALALTLLGGWLLGLASHPGGRKWRDRYNAERDAHAAARRDADTRLEAADARLRELDGDRGRLGAADARIAEIERERDLQAGELARGRESLSLAQARIRELERDNDRLSHAAPASTAPVAAASSTARPAPVAQAEPMPLTRRVVRESRTSRGWFDWGPGGDPRARRE